MAVKTRTKIQLKMIQNDMFDSYPRFRSISTGYFPQKSKIQVSANGEARYNRAMLKSKKIRSICLLFLLGAILGTFGDELHVLSQIDGYPNPMAPIPGTGQPFWVPFLFGGATVLIALSHRSRRSRYPLTFIRIVVGILAFIGLYALSAFIPIGFGPIKDLILALGAVLIWGLFDKTGIGLFHCAATALFGTAFEIMLTRSGVFFYSPGSDHLMGVPSWLPWLYVAASVAVGNSGSYLLRTPSSL